MLGNPISGKNNLLKIKNDIQNLIGTSFNVECGRGVRQKIYKDCTITNVYKNVFTVQQVENNRVASYSYVDLLAGQVRLVKNNNNNNNNNNLNSDS
ncbi:MAG: hypothetical protein LBJ93_01160 [Clostridiales bacterium]|jgi:uncharacterized protein Veg|nr:hypothetical protein [Clostridiales bacterium]